jgi:uracil-DNA glycosylase family 4
LEEEIGSRFSRLSERITKCERCPRLRSYCRDISERKRHGFAQWKYWEKPLAGFGDYNARVLVIGLAPAAHGGTRTGRMFCGDSSGDWLVKALYETGFANQPFSVSRGDGLLLRDVYLTAVVRCAPPENKPTHKEASNCLPYLVEELELLKNVESVIVLGRFAFENYLRVAHIHTGHAIKCRPVFSHGAVYALDDGKLKLYVSYHPSRRNTQTGLLTWSKWLSIFKLVRTALAA